MYGKALRLEHLKHSRSKRICLVPMDHGITIGPVEGIKNYTSTIKQVIDGGADGIILHKGLLKATTQHKELLKGKYLMHLSASTMLGTSLNAKVLVSSVEEAVKLGAEGISIHVNLGCETESEMLKDFGKVSAACNEWGMPLLAMMYVKSNNDGTIQDENKLIHAVRIAEELDADMVKLDCLSMKDSIGKLISNTNLPILVAGGSQTKNPEEFLEMLDNCLQQGASGVAIGRNIFQWPDPGSMTNLISAMVHNEITLKAAILKLRSMQEVAVCAEMK